MSARRRREHARKVWREKWARDQRRFRQSSDDRFWWRITGVSGPSYSPKKAAAADAAHAAEIRQMILEANGPQR